MEAHEVTCASNTIEENTVRSEPKIDQTLEPTSTDVLDTETECPPTEPVAANGEMGNLDGDVEDI